MSLKSGLYTTYHNAGATFVEQGGYSIPAKVSGIEKEYHALRTTMGICDYSAYTKIRLSGPGALDFLEYLLPKEIEHMPQGQIINTFLSDEKGFVLFFVWVLQDGECFYILSDAPNHGELSDYLFSQKKEDTDIEDLTETFDCFSLIGPQTLDFIINVLGEDIVSIPYLGFEKINVNAIECTLVRVGNTGEYEYRIISEKANSENLITKIVEHGEKYNQNIQLCGNDVLDILLLEMGAVNQKNHGPGSIHPLEYGLHWMISFRKERDYISKAALIDQKEKGISRKSLLMEFPNKKEIITSILGADILFEDQPAGKVIEVHYSYKNNKNIIRALIDKQVAWPTIEFDVMMDDGTKELAVSKLSPLFVTETIVRSFQD